MKGPGKKVVGYGWCGTYRYSEDVEHRLGWLLSRFISHQYKTPINDDQARALGTLEEGMHSFAASDMYRVKVTIQPVKDKRGRYIVKRTKRQR